MLRGMLKRESFSLPTLPTNRNIFKDLDARDLELAIARAVTQLTGYQIKCTIEQIAYVDENPIIKFAATICITGCTFRRTIGFSVAKPNGE